MRLAPLIALAVALAAALATPAAAQTYSYDGAGRLAQVVYADGTTITLSYDAAGNLVSNAVTPTPPVGGGSGSSGGGCFLATAAYGSPMHPHVAELREFRDEWLLTNPPGRAFVKLYYATSPPIADVIARSKVLRAATRLALAPLVCSVVYPGPTTALLGLCLLGLWIRRQRGSVRSSAVRVASVLLAAVVLAPSGRAHQVTPSNITLRPGGTDYIYVRDQGTCAATITATSTDPANLTVFALNMNTGLIGTGNGTTATVANRVDQVFIVTAASDVTMSTTAFVQICWVGEDSGSTGPCQENNCSPFAPAVVRVDIDPDASSAGNRLASGIARDPVSTSSGGFFFYERDFELGGPLSLGMGRLFSSLLTADGLPQGALGPNWRHRYDWQLSRVGNNVEVYTNEGRVVRFERGYFDVLWTLAVYEDVPFQLVQSGSTWTLADPRNDLKYTFDINGRLTSIADGRGNTHSLSYVGGKLSQVADGLGRSLSYTYNGSQLTAISDGTRSVSFTYDGSGRLATATDAMGGVTMYAYDPAFPSDAKLTARTLPNGTTPYSQVYGPDRRVASQTDADGNTWTFAYDDLTGETTVADPGGGAVVFEHDARGRMTRWTDEAGASAAFGSDPEGRRDAVVDRLGKTTSTLYDDLSGKPKRFTEADGSRTTLTYATRTLGGITTRDLVGVQLPDGSSLAATYDSSGNVLTRTDADGGVWSYASNGSGQVTSITNPAGGVTAVTYNPDGTPATITDNAGQTTSFSYDVHRRPDQVSFHDGSSVAYTYDDLDRVVSSTDELGRVTAYAYDADGNLTSTVEPNGATTTYCYDAMDRLKSVIDPLGKTRALAYDSHGRLATFTDADGAASTFGYDQRGRLSSVTDAAGNTRTRTHDAEGIESSLTSPLGNADSFASDSRGRITQRTLPDAAVERFWWDSMSRPTRYRNAEGEDLNVVWGPGGKLQSSSLAGTQVGVTRDAHGEIGAVATPGGGTWRFKRDPQGRVWRERDPIGRKVEHTYDASNRLQQTDLAGIGTATYTHDAAGRLTGMSYSDGGGIALTWSPGDRLIAGDNFTAAYDAAGRMVDSNGIGIAYDDAGRIASMTYAPGKVVTYSYYLDGRLKDVTDWVGGVTTMTYDADGNLASIARPNGVDTTFAYDPDGALNQIVHGTPPSPAPSGVSVYGQINLTRDLDNRVTFAEREMPVEGLPTQLVKSWIFDNAARIASYQWDELGRPVNDSQRSYSWGLSGRLDSIDENGTQVDYEYDAHGALVKRIALGILTEFVRVHATKFSVPAIERLNGVDFRYMIATPSGLSLHIIQASDNGRYFFHFDENYSTRILSDDAGDVAAGWDYNPFGEITASFGLVDTWFKFRGGLGGFNEGGGTLYKLAEGWFDACLGRYQARNNRLVADARFSNPYQRDGGNPLAWGDRVRGTRVLWKGEPAPAQDPERVALPSQGQLLVGSRLVAAYGGNPVARFIGDLFEAGALTYAPDGANHREVIRKFRLAADYARAIQEAASEISDALAPRARFRIERLIDPHSFRSRIEPTSTFDGFEARRARAKIQGLLGQYALKTSGTGASSAPTSATEPQAPLEGYGVFGLDVLSGDRAYVVQKRYQFGL